MVATVLTVEGDVHYCHGGDVCGGVGGDVVEAADDCYDCEVDVIVMAANIVRLWR